MGAAEKTGADGMPLEIESIDYVNSIRFPVPYTLCDLTRADRDRLDNSVYTEKWEEIVPHLNPR